jgi:2-oxoglutarate ferredoxin oxidoreductase subunit delta
MEQENAKRKKAPRKPRGEVFITREICKGCGFCVEFCPTHALELDKAFNRKGYHPPVVAKPEACSGCGLCGLYCPDFAIFAERNQAAGGQEDNGDEG